jgi:hypothetical protein
MWYKNLEKNIFITNLYTKIPQLVNVRISQIKITDEGDRISLIFDMPYFADKPPKKWVDLDYNTIIVQLDFFEVKEVIIKSNDKTYRGDIEIEKDEKGAILINVTGSVEVKIKAAVGMIQLVEGYCNHP